MSNGLRIVLGACVLCAIVLIQPAGLTQDSQLKEISGEIVSVNSQDSILVLKQIEDQTSQTYSTETLAVEKSASISKGNQVMILSDLKAGDKVTVAYAITSEGTKVVRTITVMEDDDNGAQ